MNFYRQPERRLAGLSMSGVNFFEDGSGILKRIQEYTIDRREVNRSLKTLKFKCKSDNVALYKTATRFYLGLP
jgi:hypothetical protein